MSKNNTIEQPSADDEERRKKPKPKQGTCRTTKSVTTSNTDGAQELSGHDGDGENQTSSQSSSHQKSKRGTGRTKTITTSNNDSAQDLSGDDGDGENQTSSQSSSHQKSKRGTGRTKTTTTSNNDSAQDLSGDDADGENQTSSQSSSHHKSKRGTGRTNNTETTTMNSAPSKSKKRRGGDEACNKPKKPKKEETPEEATKRIEAEKFAKTPNAFYVKFRKLHGAVVDSLLIGESDNKYDNPLHFVPFHFMSACSHSSLSFQISDAQWCNFGKDVNLSKKDRIKGIVNTQENLVRLHEMFGGTFPNSYNLRIPSRELVVRYVSPEAQGGVRELTSEEKTKKEEEPSSGEQRIMHTQNNEKPKSQKQVKRGYYRVTTNLDYSKDRWCDSVTTSTLDEKHAEITKLVDDWNCEKGHSFKELVATLFEDMKELKWDPAKLSVDEIKTRFAETCVRFEGLNRHVCIRQCEICFQEITGKEDFVQMAKYWKFLYHAMSLFRTYIVYCPIKKDETQYTSASGNFDIQMEEYKSIGKDEKLSKETYFSGKENKGQNRIGKDRSELRTYNPTFFRDRIRIMEELGVFAPDAWLRFGYEFAKENSEKLKKEKEEKAKKKKEKAAPESDDDEENNDPVVSPKSPPPKKPRKQMRTALLPKQLPGQKKLVFKPKDAQAEHPVDPEEEQREDDDPEEVDLAPKVPPLNFSDHEASNSDNEALEVEDDQENAEGNAQAERVMTPEEEQEEDDPPEKEDSAPNVPSNHEAMDVEVPDEPKKTAKPKSKRNEASGEKEAEDDEEKKEEIKADDEKVVEKKGKQNYAPRTSQSSYQASSNLASGPHATAQWDQFVEKLKDFVAIIHGSFIRLKDSDPLGQDAENLMLMIEKHHKKSYELIAKYKPSLRSGGAPPNAEWIIKQTEELIDAILRETESLQNEGESTFGKEEIDNKAVDLLRKIIEFQLKN